MRSFATIALAAAAAGIPIAGAVLYPRLPARGTVALLAPAVTAAFPPADLPLTRRTLGREPAGRPLVTHVSVVDLDRDGKPDVIASDAVLGRVVWFRQRPDGGFDERPLGDSPLPAPCRADAADLDGDGDLDLVVAVLGSVTPTDEPVGKVVWLENDGRQTFTTRVILDDLRRVSDVRVGDLNGDGQPDLAVAEFGYDRGRLLWLENRGGGRFRDHDLYALPGASHCPLADLDGDGDLDLVALVSQEDEEVVGFENRGGGNFRRRVLFAAPHFDFGAAGLVVADLTGDGKPDLLVVAGDNLEVTHPVPQPWHGAVLVENRGGWDFAPRRLAHVPGVYGVAVSDLDADGKPDIVLGCMFNDWRQPGAAAVVWLRGEGGGAFAAPRQLADAPTHVAAVAAADLDGDGRADVVAGHLHLQAPFDRLGRVTLWGSRPGGPP